MESLIFIAIGLGVLAILSGMLGLGVAFAAIPFLSFFFADLVHEVQPLSLLLNGVTATFAAWGFARSKLVDWKTALPLLASATAFAPLGAAAAQIIPQKAIWVVYFIAVLYLAYRLFKPASQGCGTPNFKFTLALSIPISIFSALLGVGPGFLLLPTMTLLCYEPKHAAAITAVVVTLPSFSALIPHLATAKIALGTTLVLVVVGAIASFLGARITSLWIPGKRLKQMFGVLIVLMSAYKLYTLL